MRKLSMLIWAVATLVLLMAAATAYASDMPPADGGQGRTAAAEHVQHVQAGDGAPSFKGQAEPPEAADAGFAFAGGTGSVSAPAGIAREDVPAAPAGETAGGMQLKTGTLTAEASDAQQSEFRILLQGADVPEGSVIVFIVPVNGGTKTVRRIAQRSAHGYTAQVAASELERPGIYTAEAYCTVDGRDQLDPVGRGDINVAGLLSSDAALGLSDSGVQGEFIVTARAAARGCIKRMTADIWCSQRPGEMRTYALVENGGTWTAKGNISSFGRAQGSYNARITAVLENGVRAAAGAPSADILPRNYTWVETDDKGATVHVENAQAGAADVQFDAWSRAEGQDDLVHYTATRQEDGDYLGRIEYRRHKNAGMFEVEVLQDGQRSAHTRFYVPETNVPKDEPMRGVWIPSVYNLDFPRSKADPGAQMEQFRTIVRNCKDWGFNAMFVQIRPTADALYRSEINPWSVVLTGRHGTDPGYDPLAFMIETAHGAGLELHAWLNPYRVCSAADRPKLDARSVAVQHPEWVLEYEQSLFLDPAEAGVRQHIADTVHEILGKYAVDGIHFDDYFYPYGYPLPEKEPHDGAVGNQRRENVNMLVRMIADEVHSWPGHIEFGVSPFGVWKNVSSDPEGSATSADTESCYSNFCDSLAWVREGILDYVCPQLYWETGHAEAGYAELADWWAQAVEGTGTDLIIGQGIYKETIAGEIEQELQLNQNYSVIRGSIFYRYGDIESQPQLAQRLKQWYSAAA